MEIWAQVELVVFVQFHFKSLGLLVIMKTNLEN